jgi:Major Facilitator Superfamily
MSRLGNYDALLRTAGSGRLVAGHLTARLPTGLASVALLATASSSHLAAPGLAIAAYGVSVAVTTVVTSRLTDRRGLRTVLFAAAFLTFAGATALVWRPSTAVFLVGAALLGTAFTPVGNGLRLSLLSPDLAETSRVAGNAYETVVMEVGALAGPAVAGLLIAAGHVDASFWAIGLAALLGVALMASSPLLRRFDAVVKQASTTVRGSYFALYRGGTWVIPLVALLVTTALSAAEVGLFVDGSARWSPKTAAVLIACMSVGSLVGGLVYGARSSKVQYVRLGVAFAGTSIVGLGLLGLALQSGSLVATAAAALVAQVGVAPLVVVLARLLPSLAPPNRVAEAYGLLSLGAFSGAVLGGLASAAFVGARAFVPAVIVTAAATLLLSRLPRIAPATATLPEQAEPVVDLTGRDLTAIDLTGIDLTAIDLTAIDLTAQPAVELPRQGQRAAVPST